MILREVAIPGERFCSQVCLLDFCWNRCSDLKGHSSMGTLPVIISTIFHCRLLIYFAVKKEPSVLVNPC